jgi:hypothetical protein
MMKAAYAQFTFSGLILSDWLNLRHYLSFISSLCYFQFNLM